MKVYDLAKQYEEYIVSMRRHFHENPELSDKEFKTVEKISQELTQMGVCHKVIENGGVLAWIKGETDNGKSILLRADVDALPVTESPDNLVKGGKTCVSKIEGVMHACGHDGHTAMLLGAAKILCDKRDEIEGTIYLCFERGEEGGHGQGYIFKYLDDNNIKIDTAFGVHLISSQPSGKVIINDREMMASNAFFRVEIKGRGGHGSRPDEANSPIDCFVAIYQRLMALRLQKVNPFGAFTYSVGDIYCGTVCNVIPDSLMFSGMARAVNVEDLEKFFDELERVVINTAKAYDCEVQYRFNRLIHPPVINDTHLAQFAREVIGEELGTENVGTSVPWMASETYANYLERYGGLFAFVGVANEKTGCGAPNHSPEFDIDDTALKNGSATEAIYAIEYLKKSCV